MKLMCGMLLIAVMLASVTVVSAVSVGSNAASVANVANTAPYFLSVEIEPDDDPSAGFQVINPDPSANKTVRLIAVLSDMNGYDDISHIYANISGPSHVGSFILNMNRSINVSTALYECAFNLSDHPEGEYIVNLRASDIGGITAYASVNFTYSYAPPLNFTVYDFSEGAGEDKWAYRKQHDEKPPSRNDVPKREFSLYGMISEDDGMMAVDATDDDGNYAIHRFKFKIRERDIKRIEVLWDGIGTHILGERGATLYVWNFSSGAYEEIDKSTDVFITLRGNITENIRNYIEDGIFIVAVEQNSPQSMLWWLKLRSYIATDYICVNVSYIPRTILNISDVKPTALVVRPGADIRFDVNVTNEGAPGIGYVSGAIVYPNGTICDIGFEKTEHMDTGETSTVYLHWTVPDDAPAGIYGFIASSWDTCDPNDGCDGLQDELYVKWAFIVIYFI